MDVLLFQRTPPFGDPPIFYFFLMVSIEFQKQKECQSTETEWDVRVLRPMIEGPKEAPDMT